MCPVPGFSIPFPEVLVLRPVVVYNGKRVTLVGLPTVGDAVATSSLLFPALSRK